MGWFSRIRLPLVTATLVFFIVGPSQANDPSKHTGKAGESPMPRDKWAVLIGVRKPQDVTLGECKTADGNVAALADCLKSETAGRFAHDHVRTLTNEEATSAAIRSTVLDNWLCKKALPNDLIVIYLAGNIVASSDHADAVFCSFDLDPSQPSASGIPLKRLLADVHSRTQSKQIICLLDTSPANPQITSADIKELTKVEHIAQDCHVTVVSADQLFYKSHDLPVTGTSAFCHYLVDGIQSGAGQLPLDTLADYVAQNIHSDSEKAHKPQALMFIVDGENPSMATIAFGCNTKVGSTKQLEFGYRLDKLAEERPDLLETNRKHERQADTDEADVEHSATADVDMHPYMAKMKHDIQVKWRPPKGVTEHQIVAVFTIKHDGTIVHPTIIEGSGVDDVDKSALEALREASPVDALPNGAPESIQIQYKFDWHVNNQLDNHLGTHAGNQ